MKLNTTIAAAAFRFLQLKEAPIASTPATKLTIYHITPGDFGRKLNVGPCQTPNARTGRKAVQFAVGLTCGLAGGFLEGACNEWNRRIGTRNDSPLGRLRCDWKIIKQCGGLCEGHLVAQAVSCRLSAAAVVGMTRALVDSSELTPLQRETRVPGHKGRAGCAAQLAAKPADPVPRGIYTCCLKGHH
eukprot:gene6652-6877_t